MPKSFTLDPQDRTLFRQAVGPIKPLHCDRIEPTPYHPAPIPRFSDADERQALIDLLSGSSSRLNWKAVRSCITAARACSRPCYASCAAASSRSVRRWICTA